jgi:methionine-rich copper-binding protein CopC
VTVENGSIGQLNESQDGLTYTAQFTPNPNITDSDNKISVDMTNVTDIAGNQGEGTITSTNYSVDTKIPTLVSIGMDDQAIKVGDKAIVTFTFSEAVSNFSTTNVTVENGSIGQLNESQDGLTYTAQFTPKAYITDSDNKISVDMTNVTDIAGNQGEGTIDSELYSVDTSAPSISYLSGWVANIIANNVSSDKIVTANTSGVEDGQKVIFSLNNETYTGDVESNKAQVTIPSTHLQALNNQQSYTLFVNVEDAAENAAVTFTHEFYVDTVIPTLSTSNPVSDAQDVPIDSDIVLTFSEPVVMGYGNIMIIKTNPYSVEETIAISNASNAPVNSLVDGFGTDTITINPEQTLEAGTEYNIKIDRTIFRDDVVNLLANNLELNFTTQQPQAGIHDLSLSDNTTNSGINLNLTDPITYDGKYYYFLDQNGDNVIDTNFGSGDLINHNALDTLLNSGDNTLGYYNTSDNLDRSITLDGSALVLPTSAELMAFLGSGNHLYTEGEFWTSDIYTRRDDNHYIVKLQNGASVNAAIEPDSNNYAVIFQVIPLGSIIA